MKGRIVICDYCGTPADFVDSSVVYHGHSFGMIYLCPRCGAYVGVHKGSDKPLGRLANSELRNWKRRLMQHLTRSGNTVPTVVAGMRPTAGCPRRWAPRLNLRILECSMWTSAARWSASCEKKGASYGGHSFKQNSISYYSLG